MQHSTHQIELYFDPQSNIGKQTLAYAISERFAVHEIDFFKTPLTGTQIMELAQLMGKTVEDLVNKEHLKFEELNFENFDDEDWLKILIKYPELMKSPIAQIGKKAIIVNTPTDIMKLFSNIANS